MPAIRLLFVARVLGGTVFVGAIGVLLGWTLDNTPFQPPLFAIAGIKANTALGLMLCSAALVAITKSQPGVVLRSIIAIATLIAITLATTTLLEYFCGCNLGIDQWLIADNTNQVSIEPPGRMTPTTACSFLLCGGTLAFILGEHLWPRHALTTAMALAGVIATIGAAALMGRVVEALFHVQLWNYSAMSALTAAAFFLLGLGFLAALSDRSGFRWCVDSFITAGFVLSVFMILTLAGFYRNSIRTLQETTAWVGRTHQVIGEIDELRGAMASLESSQRGYLLLRDERLLDSRSREKETVQDSLASLRTLTAVDSTQQQFLARIADVIQQRIAFGDLNITTFRQEGFPAAQRQLAAGAGITLTAQINNLLDQMRGREAALLAVREEQTELISRTTFLLMPVGILLSLATLAVALFFLNAGLAEQGRAERDLKNSNKEVFDLRDAMDQHAIVAITDPQGRITFANDKFCAISRYSRAELLGQDHRIINSGYHSKEFFRELWQTISHGQVWHGEVRNRAKDGTIYWVDTTIVPFLNPDGKPRQYVAIRADITERKRNEEATARLAAIVDSSSDAIIGKDLDSIVTSWNRGAEQLSGYTAAEMIGQSITRLLPDDRRHEEAELIARVRRGERVSNLETVRRAKDGHLLDLSITVSPIHDKDGKIIGVSSVARDISARRQAEQEIRQLNATLERRVAERTVELEAANKELEAFSYSVSHDLRAPLRAVDGFSQAVIEDYNDLLPDEGKRDLKTIRESAQRMGVLIDDLLAFARLSRVALDLREVDMSRLVARVLAELSDQHEGRDLDITVENLPACQGTPALLEHVWTNLLANSIKYTRKREKALIQVGSRQENGETVYFVRDNGAGFDMRYAHKLFGVFQRLHRADEFEGTGVGLAIVQRIIHRHGGRIWAESAVNAGATFRFTLGHLS